MRRNTKARRHLYFYTTAMNLGFTLDDADQLLSIERTLHRWAEDECNGDITREEATDKPFRHYGRGTRGPMQTVAIPDREKAALARLAKIMGSHPGLIHHHQRDPRGCALYILRRSDLADRDIRSCYSMGWAVCI
jgi:hypothetical protein